MGSSVVPVRPGSIEPLVRVLGDVLPLGSLAGPLGDIIASQVVDSVRAVWSGAHVDGRLWRGSARVSSGQGWSSAT